MFIYVIHCFIMCYNVLSHIMSYIFSYLKKTENQKRLVELKSMQDGFEIDYLTVSCQNCTWGITFYVTKDGKQLRTVSSEHLQCSKTARVPLGATTDVDFLPKICAQFLLCLLRQRVNSRTTGVSGASCWEPRSKGKTDRCKCSGYQTLSSLLFWWSFSSSNDWFLKAKSALLGKISTFQKK